MPKRKRGIWRTDGSRTKISNKSMKDQSIVTTVRLELDLSESNENSYPIFNYFELLKSAQEKQAKAKEQVDLGVSPNDKNLWENDEDNNVLEITRYYEKKYGNCNDYMDLGAGYDEEDTFIDNTDAYDEVVPKEITTAHGGFYINTGPLEFKDLNTPKDQSLAGSSEGHKSGGEERKEEKSESDKKDVCDDKNKEVKAVASKKGKIVSKSANKRGISSSEEEIQGISRKRKLKLKKTK